MSRPVPYSLLMLSATRRMRRAVALAACLAVVCWSLLAAIHLHEHDGASGTDRAAECALCLAMPAGAAPPADLVLAVSPPPSATVVDAPHLPVASSGSRSSYRSRAPPAV